MGEKFSATRALGDRLLDFDVRGVECQQRESNWFQLIGRPLIINESHTRDSCVFELAVISETYGKDSDQSSF
jgi:hypothetical protein